jgi:hypothetical protein
MHAVAVRIQCAGTERFAIKHYASVVVQHSADQVENAPGLHDPGLKCRLVDITLDKQLVDMLKRIHGDNVNATIPKDHWDAMEEGYVLILSLVIIMLHIQWQWKCLEG